MSERGAIEVTVEVDGVEHVAGTLWVNQRRLARMDYSFARDGDKCVRKTGGLP